MSQSVGLFGGSFNPAHEGHLHAAMTAQRACRLDRVWWMPSPQNPLKPEQPSWESRARTVERLKLPYGHSVSDIEVRLGTQFTIDTLRAIKRRHPTTRFVFVMGADNLAQFPRWKDWQGVLNTVPLCVVARPTTDVKARLGRVARQYARHRLPERAAAILKFSAPPAWVFLTTPHHGASSSAIRAATADPRPALLGKAQETDP